MVCRPWHCNVSPPLPRPDCKTEMIILPVYHIAAVANLGGEAVGCGRICVRLDLFITNHDHTTRWCIKTCHFIFDNSCRVFGEFFHLLYRSKREWILSNLWFTYFTVWRYISYVMRTSRKFISQNYLLKFTVSDIYKFLTNKTVRM